LLLILSILLGSAKLQPGKQRDRFVIKQQFLYITYIKNCYSSGYLLFITAKFSSMSNPIGRNPMTDTTTRKPALGLLAMADLKAYQVTTGEIYMNDAQLLHFKKILEVWHQQLRAEVDRTVIYMQDEAANFPDPTDRATQEEEFSLELRNRDRERKLIKKIERTLLKIESNDFGYCTACGIEIGIRRLEARPTADLCIDCKTLAEIREKQLTG
jgi:DnaK suppressor protein